MAIDAYTFSTSSGDATPGTCGCANTAIVVLAGTATATALDVGGFGVDIDVITDLSKTWRLVGGLRNLAQAIVRRLTTPRGGLAFDDPNYGIDVRNFLGASLSPVNLASKVERSVSSEVAKDPRVQAARVTVDINFATQAMTINVSIDTATGPFALVLQVTALTVQLLTVQAGQ